MGRYDFRPLQVYKTATMQLQAAQTPYYPPWYHAIADFPPATALVRAPAIQHGGTRLRKKNKKPSRMYQPTPISYAEDKLRSQFFGDHPWELARPRVILEDDGKDSYRADWSRPTQSGRPIDGESVIQRQQYLAAELLAQSSGNAGRTPITKSEAMDQAYNQARKEFYDLRRRQEVETRVAREEALATGAEFGLGPLELGMNLENKTWEEWKVVAERAAEKMQQDRAGAYTGAIALELETGEDSTVVDDVEETNTGVNATSTA